MPQLAAVLIAPCFQAAGGGGAARHREPLFRLIGKQIAEHLRNPEKPRGAHLHGAVHLSVGGFGVDTVRGGAHDRRTDALAARRRQRLAQFNRRGVVELELQILARGARGDGAVDHHLGPNTLGERSGGFSARRCCRARDDAKTYIFLGAPGAVIPHDHSALQRAPGPKARVVVFIQQARVDLGA